MSAMGLRSGYRYAADYSDVPGSSPASLSRLPATEYGRNGAPLVPVDASMVGKIALGVVAVAAVGNAIRTVVNVARRRSRA